MRLPLIGTSTRWDRLRWMGTLGTTLLVAVWEIGRVVFVGPGSWLPTMVIIGLTLLLANFVSVSVTGLICRLEGRIESQNRELTTLNAVIKGINESPDLDGALRCLLDEALKATGAEVGLVWLLADGSTVVSSGLTQRFVQDLIDGGALQRLYQLGPESGETVFIPDSDPRHRIFAGRRTGGWRPRWLAVVPIALKGMVLGMLGVGSSNAADLSSRDLSLLRVIGEEAGVAVENARLYEETKRLAATDPLTEVWNRRHIQERLGTEIARARRFGHELSVLVMDIDNLKLFNDTYGHPAGDKVIRTVAQVVLTSCRETDIVGRYGGDEFAVLLPETDPQGATMIAGRILNALNKAPFRAPGGTEVPIRISIGATSYPSDSDELNRLFSLADAAMYRVKVAGGGQFASRKASPEEVPEELVAGFDALQGLLITVDAKDRYTFKHSQEVTETALVLARALGLSEEEMRVIATAGKLHDLGKIGILTSVLRKPGSLTPEEWEIVREHPHLGYLIMQQIPQMEKVLEAVLHHHERWDGNGYPDGLKGKQIPKLARILAIADAYSAMLADRPYRKALSQQEALQEIQNCAGTQFDPELAELFVDLFLSDKQDNKASVSQAMAGRA